MMPIDSKDIPIQSEPIKLIQIIDLRPLTRQRRLYLHIYKAPNETEAKILISDEPISELDIRDHVSPNAIQLSPDGGVKI